MAKNNKKQVLNKNMSYREKRLEEQIRLKDNHIRNLEAVIEQLNREIAQLRLPWHKKLIRRLKGVLSCIRRFAGRLLPVGSRRRFVLGSICRAVRHPKRQWELLFEIKKGKLLAGDRVMDILYMQHGSLCFDKVDAPAVSIIIPVYNQIEYTMACLRSIKQYTSDISYEIIVADDVSTDGTRYLGEYVKGLTICRNKTNQGFLRNCNQAAATARGRYVLFLNNDTQVTAGWASSLVNLMESDSSIGMVGSKLIYPSGVLQEAGGILWSDGSGWNYGRNGDASAPEYNYVRDTDYISGASILLSRELWQELGGFRETFAPAYCEDSDLALRIWEKGLRVVYQPKSVVIHFEGVSNGTDTAGAGLKRYQIENSKKLAHIWKKQLEAEHCRSPKELFVAREHGRHKKFVLFIDHYVPTFDMDAGSRSTFAFMKAFVKMGYGVKFIGDNFLRTEPYTGIMEQCGIEVLGGSRYALGWEDWLRDNGRYLDVVFANRPHITVKYVDAIREHTKATLIYYGHDLHYLRGMREYELTKNPETLETAEYMRELEYRVMEQSDIVYYPSEEEAAIVRREAPQVNVKAIPAYIFEGSPAHVPAPENRSGLLFVGGFAHTPNKDAVLWFVESILPLIRKQLPDVVFHIVGSKAPEEITSLACETIQVHGFVTDEELAELYASCRLAVVPLRYGAGLKGKVVESMYYQIPTVTTSIGAEGLHNVENALAVVDEAQAFAACVLALYVDESEQKRRMDASAQYIRENFSMDAVTAVLEADLAQ